MITPEWKEKPTTKKSKQGKDEKTWKNRAKFIFGATLIFLSGAIAEKTLFLEKINVFFQNKFENNQYHGKTDEVFKIIFTDELMPDQILPEIKDANELHQVLDSWLVPADSFEFAYQKIILGTPQELRANIWELPFQYRGRDMVSRFYKKKSQFSDKKEGFLVIPGSGSNRSYQIFNNTGEERENQIDENLSKFGDCFIQIKPNESAFALHHKGKKLNSEGIYANLINQGGSYSAYYLLKTLALSKFLKTEYAHLNIAGLSQGGYATLLVSLQAKPQKAVVASGYSVLFDEIEIAGINQIIMPGMKKWANAATIRDSLQKSPTQFLFTYGKIENDIYKVEAFDHTTEKYFENLNNVKFGFHERNHRYDYQMTNDFFAKP
jgi:hypothetical protein